MPAPLHRLLHLLHLTRLAWGFTAVSNCWMMIFLAYGLRPPDSRPPILQNHGLGLLLFLAAAVAAGLHTYAIALNDLLDARHDRLFAPDRPIPAGAIPHRAAAIVAVLSLLIALLAAVFLGPTSVILCLVAAAAILFFNAAGKFLPAVGILALAAIRCLIMLIPLPTITLAWPLWLTVSHVIVCWALAYRIEGKRPRLLASEWWLLCAGWAVGTIGLVRWSASNPALAALPSGGWLLPILAIVLFFILATRILSRADHPRSRRAAGAAFLRLALLWLILYDVAWLAGARLYTYAAIHALLFLLAYASTHFLRLLDTLASAAPAPRAQPLPAPKYPN